jgi:phage baseplate assembly protein W
MPTFLGWSTVGRRAERTMDWRLYDQDLIRRDLLNNFNTFIGSRVMRPDWGCAIWDYLMEPMTPGNLTLIENEAVRICNADSRVSIQSLNVITYQNGIRVEILLLNIMTQVVFTFTADFENRQTSYYSGANSQN